MRNQILPDKQTEITLSEGKLPVTKYIYYGQVQRFHNRGLEANLKILWLNDRDYILHIPYKEYQGVSRVSDTRDALALLLATLLIHSRNTMGGCSESEENDTLRSSKFRLAS
jgi:hypothetical protein